MRKHVMRLWTILMAYALIVGGVLVSVVLKANAEIITALLGAFAVLTPALVDAVAVERRRRAPSRRAVEDDIGPNITVPMPPLRRMPKN